MDRYFNRKTISQSAISYCIQWAKPFYRVGGITIRFILGKLLNNRLLGAGVLLLLAAWALHDPFSFHGAEARLSLMGLAPAQVQNIQQALKALDGKVIQPGEMFSFNQTVGPRTMARGFGMARSYLEADSPMTLGGGVCVASSLLYQAALEADLVIKERLPHTKATQRILPGLDATVWYGQADLKFRNTLKQPVKIYADMHHQDAVVRLDSTTPYQVLLLRRDVQQTSPKTLWVTVSKKGHQKTVISRNRYRLAGFHKPLSHAQRNH